MLYAKKLFLKVAVETDELVLVTNKI